MTRALLLEGAAHVIAVEKDFRAGSVLSSLIDAANGRLELVEADALKTNLWEIGTAPRRIVANLPYNIATSLLIQWLEHASASDAQWDSLRDATPQAELKPRGAPRPRAHGSVVARKAKPS